MVARSRFQVWIFRAALLMVLAGAPVSLSRDSANCSADDPSATFSDTISLPAAGATEFLAVREAMARGDFGSAEKLLRSLPLTSDRWLWEGVLLLQEKETFASIRVLEKAADLLDSSAVETLLGMDYLLLNQRLLAQQALNRALSLDPKDSRALYLRGRLHFIRNGFSRAREDFTAVLAKEHNDYRSLYYLGLSDYRLGNEAAAHRNLLSAYEVLNCHNISFYLVPKTLSEIELHSGQTQAALAHATAALKMAEKASGKDTLREEMPDALLMRAKVHTALGNLRDAEADLRRALALDQDLDQVWYLLAKVYRQRGETERAEEAIVQFQRIRDEL
jgi:tetratricopeptide (TPR) repeat protein